MSVNGKSWWGITAAWISLAALAAAAMLFAGRAQAQVFSPEQIADINRIETYLDQLTTLDSRFVQIDPNGNFSEGTVFLSRPGRMRFEYDPPSPLLLVADGTWFIYVDKELEEVSHIPLDSTPAAFLLQEEISLKDQYKVTDISRGSGLVTVDIIERYAPENGKVQLVFEDRPLQLKQWNITDAQGLDTRVTLINSRFGRELEDEMFRFKDPWSNAIGDR
ncbi:LolA family protein [Hwanghaeella sp.]|uniref:LolA family protein n=1 Tax=Hwanghaeella sp. TaxID=2605943 RepID=UPI003CCC4655